MALMAVDVGELLLLEYMLNKVAATDWVMKLYSNNKTPAEGDTVANYTECTYAGYGAATLTGTSWSVATVANVTTATYSEQTFTFSEAASVYGYYYVDGTGATLLVAERFSGAPYTLPSGGGSISITPKLTLD